jgi:uncharacterized membrane protein YkoI
MGMTRNLLVGAVAAAALVVTAGTAFALSSDDTPRTAAQPATTTSTSTVTSSSDSTSTPTSDVVPLLSPDDAARIANERVPGAVVEIEQEFEHGRVEWKVEIAGTDGVRYDVRVDAETGSITRVDTDGRPTDDRPTDHRATGTPATSATDDHGYDDHGGDRHGDDDRGGDDNPGGHDRGGDDHGGGRHGGDDH